MAAIKIIGKVGVKVFPDTSKFKKELKPKLQKIEDSVKGLEVEILPKITENSKARVKLEMDKLRKQMNGKVEIKPELNDRAVIAIETALEAIQRKRRVRVDAGLNDGALAATEGVLDFLARTRKAMIDPEVKLGSVVAAEAILDTLTRGRVTSLETKLNPKGVTEFLAMLGGIRPQLEGWSAMFDGVIKNFDKFSIKAGVAATKLTAIGSASVASIGQVLSLSHSIAGIGPLALTLPGLVSGIGLGLIAWGVAMKDFNQHFSQFAVGLGKIKAGPAWAALQNVMSDRFWKQAEGPMAHLIKTLFPQFAAGMKQISTDLGAFTGALSTSLTGKMDGAFKGMFDALGKSIQITTKHTDSFATIIQILGEIGAKQLPALARWFGRIADQFANFLQVAKNDGSLSQWISTGKSNLAALGRVVGNVYRIFSGFTQAASTAGGSSLQSLASGLGKVADAVHRADFQAGLIDTFDAAYRSMRAFADAAGPGISAAILAIRDVLNGAGPGIAKGLGDIVGAFGTALSDPKVMSGASAMFAGISSAMQTIANSAGPLVTIFASLGAPIGAMLTAIANFSAAGLERLAPTIATIAQDSTPIIQKMGDLFTKIGNTMAPVFETVAKFIDKAVKALGPLIDAFSQLFDIVGPILVPVLKVFYELLGGAIMGVIQGVTLFVKGLVNILSGLGDLFGGLWKVIKSLFTLDFSGVWDGLKQMGSGLWKIILGLLEVVLGAIWTWLNGSFVGILKRLPLMLIKGLGAALKVGFKAMGGLFKSLMESLLNGSLQTKLAGLLFNGIKSVMSGLWSGIKALFSLDVGAFIKGIGKKIWDGFLALLADFSGLGELFSGLWTNVKAVFMLGWNAIKEWLFVAWNKWVVRFEEIFNGIKGIASKAWNGIKTVFTTVWNAIKDWFGQQLANFKLGLSLTWDAIKTRISNVWNGIKQVFINVFNGIKSTVTEKIDSVKGFLSGAWDTIKSTVSAAFETVKTLVKNKLGDVVEAAKKLPGKVLGALGDLTSYLYNSGWALISGFLKGITDRFGDVYSTVSGKLGELRKLFPFSPAKEGPFSGKGYTTYSGAALMGGFLQGMESQFGNVIDSTKSFMQQVSDELSAGSDYRIGVKTEFANDAKGLTANVARTVSASVSATANANGSGDISIDNITIPLDDLKQLKTLEEFMAMLRVRTRQGVLA